MTGSDIQELRIELEMTVPQFAQLLGVHLASVYRWEAARNNEVRLDPLQVSLLARIQHAFTSRRRGAGRERWRAGLLRALLFGGTLVALAFLLAELLPADLQPVKRRR